MARITTPKFVFLDIDDTIFNTDLFKKSKQKIFSVYKEVDTSLEELSKIATLGIFSKGEISLQKRKLQKTNIDKYFDKEHIFIVEDKIAVIKSTLKEYNKKGEVFLIEDRLPLLQMLKEQVPSIHAIWIQRGRYVDLTIPCEVFSPDNVVTNLQDTIPFIVNA